MRGFDLRKLQLIELEMLKDVVSFCEKNDIQYFLSDGTLIGAARHQGFIPWDDDIDICMDYKNFKKFNKLATKSFDKKYFVQNHKTERKYPFPWTKIRINSTTSMERHLNNYDIHFGICMDILVLNGISDNKFRRKLQVKSAKLQRDLLKKYYYLEGDIKFDSKKKQIMYKYLPEWARRSLIKILDKFIYSDISKCSFCYENFYSDINACAHFSTEWFKEYDALMFEGEKFSVPVKYDNYLTKLYGDWRTPPKEVNRNGHGDIIVDFENDYSLYWGDKLKTLKNK